MRGGKTVWAVRGWGGARSTLTPQYPRTLVLAANSANKKCWRSVHFSEMPQTKREKPHTGFSPPPRPGQRAEDRRMSSVPCWLLRLLLSWTLRQRSRRDRRRTVYNKNIFFFVYSRGKSFILRKGPQKSGGWGKRQGCCGSGDVMLPTVSLDPRTSLRLQWASLSMASLWGKWSTQQTSASTCSGPESWLNTGDPGVPAFLGPPVYWNSNI